MVSVPKPASLDGGYNLVSRVRNMFAGSRLGTCRVRLRTLAPALVGSGGPAFGWPERVSVRQIANNLAANLPD